MNDERGPEDVPDDPWLVDRLLDDATGPELHGAPGLSDLVSALRAPGGAAELANEGTYLQVFDAVVAETATDIGQWAPTEGKSLRTIVIGYRAAAVAAVAVVALAGAAAAYTGGLPGSLQSSAHHYLGAPAAQPAADDSTDTTTDTPSGTSTESPSTSLTSSATRTGGVGPDATGSAAFGLCTAWSHGGLATTSTAYRNLVTAAGDSTGITAYCTTVLAGHTHGTGSPTSHSTGHPTGHPTGHAHPTGSPSTHPGHN